ncbi:lantibiotic dehydratase [Streptomyces sp. NPDC088337]|uniref:lantibiotic dehydratase n=1 Tax=unclassified Streptomyces TaxID=2593676 RepID=UPI0038074AC0
MIETHFTASKEVFFRLPMLPVERGLEAAFDSATARCVSDEALVRYLLEITRDPVFREALEVSSPSLAQVINKIEEEIPVSRRRLERAAVSATRYLLRATMRPTPFGLMAGVTVGSFSDGQSTEINGAHTKRVTVDAAWAEKFVAGLLERADVRHQVQVISNNLRYKRGDRIVLPLVRYSARPKQRESEVTVRGTPVVSFALESARRPLRYVDLLDSVLKNFPALDRERLDAVLFSLLKRGFLVSNVSPRSDLSDPMEPVRDFLVRQSLGEEVRAVDEALAEYQSKPIGDGLSAWRSAVDVMEQLVPDVRHPLQVDLKIDGEMSLPHSVREEAEKIASLLWEMSDPEARYPHLAEYHTAFLEEYGTHRLVPVLELLNPHSGIDAPAGYLNPPSARQIADASAQRSPDGARELAPEQEECLSELVEQALLCGRQEISLSEKDISRLVHGSVRSPVGSVDLCLQLLSTSPADMAAGDFIAVVSPFAQGRSAGSMLGRFVDVVDAHDDMRQLLSLGGRESVIAQINFAPLDHRSLNVAAVPQLVNHTIPVGQFPGHGEVLELDDLAVGATADRMYLVRISDGREVRPVVPHSLNLHGQAPNVVRFLSEIAYSGESRWRSWGWGKNLRSLPYLPRIRYGRSTLSLARWRPGVELSQKREWSAWRVSLDAWRQKWSVPDHVQLAAGDNRIELDLRREWHCRLLRDQLQRNTGCLIFESPMSDRRSLGWSYGYAPEVVVALSGNNSQQPQALPSSLDLQTAVSAPRRYAPGSEWLYVKFYMSEEMEERFLWQRLPDLLRSLPSDCVDRWFYIRYRDPLPHIRLRLHGTDRERLWGEVLPALSSWVSSPVNVNIVHGWVVDAYVPEAARYGGPTALERAEGVFQRDSEYCVGQLQLRAADRSETPLEVLAARSYVDFLTSFGEWAWKEWVVRTLPRAQKRIAFDVGKFREFVLRNGPTQTDSAASSVSQIAHLARARDEAVSKYAALLIGPGNDVESASAKILSVLHMHANRLMGVDREAENRSYALLRAVALSELNRRS